MKERERSARPLEEDILQKVVQDYGFSSEDAEVFRGLVKKISDGDMLGPDEARWMGDRPARKRAVSEYLHKSGERTQKR